MKRFSLFFLFFVLLNQAFSQTTPLWLRYPSISPDGKTIAFGYKGDIYLVPAGGGTAVPLTIHEAHDMMPVWSHDGKYIAFASDRYGNFDVFVLPVSGGTPRRLTYHSANDYPQDFSVDNKEVIFSGAHTQPASNVRFPSPRLFQNLYRVPVTGGRPLLVSAAGIERAKYNTTGTRIVFEDRKGYEDPLRKHHVSSVTRDIWIYNLKDQSYTKITDFAGEDREPVFSRKSDAIYYISEKDGTLNIYKKDTPEGASDKELTTFKEFPVRHLSIADDDQLCFSWNGEIYTLRENETPHKVNINIINDGRNNVVKPIKVEGDISEFALSPGGKEVATVSRGEIFVSSLEGGQTKRITNTPEQERMVQWAPDGKSLIYAAERNGSWNIYKTSLVRKDEPYFYAATVLKEEQIIATGGEEYQPKYSPDGKEIAYIAERNILKVYNIATGKTTTLLPQGHNYSYSDGDWNFEWSPDSKWIITDDSKGYFSISNAALIKADGSGPILYPINSGFGERNSKWALNGKMFTWMSSREGRKSLANQGRREMDIYGVFFDREAFDRYMLSKTDFELLKEQEEKQKKDSVTASSKKGPAKKGKTKKVEPAGPGNFTPDLTDLETRTVKLTINSASISDYVFNKEASKLYYLAQFEKGYDLWVTEPRTHDTKILAKLGGSPSGIEISQDGKFVVVSNNGKIVKVDTENGKISGVPVNGEMKLDAAAERNYIYEHAWRQVTKKFYDPKIHGVKWDLYHTAYARFLPHITDNYDFQELLSELLGELNASHTGGRFYPRVMDADKTASLGVIFDETYTGTGVKIAEVLAGGPLDKAGSKIKAGYIIEKIDGQPIDENTDWYKFLDRKEDKNTLLSVYNPIGKVHFEEVMKPISIGEEGALMYKRWTNKMRQMVDKLSGGKVGYVHVEGMDDASFRAVYDDAMGRDLDKKALIVDTRFNGGGWLHDDLNTFLSGKQYLQFAPQGNLLQGGEPLSRWQKPSCVVMSEGNYSDAFIFPYVYKQNGIGKLIGMPVAGTGTAVWWETQIDPTLIFGIPMVATIGKELRPTENLQVEPDIRVPLPYEDFLNGKDPQIEAAVKEMLKEIEGK